MSFEKPEQEENLQENNGEKMNDRAPESPMDIAASIQELTEQIKLSQRITEKEIEEKLVEQKGLIAEEGAAANAIQEGEKQLAYFRKRQEVGEFKDSKSEELIAQLEEKIAVARNALQEVKARADSIAKRPEVMERVEDEARKEHEGRQKMEELLQRVEEIEKLEAEYQDIIDKRTREQKELKNGSVDGKALSELLNSYSNQAREMKAYDLADFILNAGRYDDVASAIEGLSKYRDKLGIFSGKEKKIVDILLKELPPKIEASRKRMEYFNNLVDQTSALEVKISNAGKEYRLAVNVARDLLGRERSYENKDLNAIEDRYRKTKSSDLRYF